MRKTILDIAHRVLSNPTAPYREQLVRKAILDFCNDIGVHTEVDPVGNVIARISRSRKAPSVAFSAHMDHPGFIIEKAAPKNVTALFYGCVERNYFPGSKVVVFTQNGPRKSRVLNAVVSEKDRAIRVRLSPVDCAPGDLACWDLPPIKIKGDLLYSRACDDLIGCVSLLALFETLVKTGSKARVTGLFTIAEESGLNGAKYICAKKLLPSGTPVISIETSAHRPGASIGNGVVIRVGDRKSIFSPVVTDSLVQTAVQLAKRSHKFKFQRKLMDAGTCEATIYQNAALAAGAICICLGNYHNRHDKRISIAPEFVSLSDIQSMVELFVEITRTPPQPRPYKSPVFQIKKGPLGQINLL